MAASMSDRHRGNSSGSERTSVYSSTDRHGWYLSDGRSSSSKMKLICSFGGQVLPRPGDGNLRYVGGETRILSFEKILSFDELSQRLTEIYGALSPPLILKYQLPGEELDTLVQVSSDEDLQIMMEEHSKVDYGKEGLSHMRLFLFESVDSIHPIDTSCGDLEQRFIDAINGVPEQRQRIAIGDDGGATKQSRNQTNSVYPPVSWLPPTELVQRSEVLNHYPVDPLPLNPNLPIESVQKPEVFTHHPVDSLPLLYPKPPIEAVHRPVALAYYPVDTLTLNPNPNPPIELVPKPEVFTHCPVNSLTVNPNPPIKPVQRSEVFTQYPVDSLLLNSKPLNESVHKPEAFTHYPVDSSFPLNPNPPIKPVQKPEIFTRHPVDSLPLNPTPPIEPAQKPDVFTWYPVDALPLHPNPLVELAQRPGVFNQNPVNSFPLNPNPLTESAQKPEVFTHYPVNTLPLNPKLPIRSVQRSEVLTHYPIDSLPLNPNRPEGFTQFPVDSLLQNPKLPIESLHRPEVFTEHSIGSLLLNSKPPIESVQRPEFFTQCPVDSLFPNPNSPVKSVQRPEIRTQHPPDSLHLYPKTPFELAPRPEEVRTQYPVDALLLNHKTRIESVQRPEVLTQDPVNSLPPNPNPPIESVQRPEVFTQYPVNSLPLNPTITTESAPRPDVLTHQYPVDSLHLPPHLASSSSHYTPLSSPLSYFCQTFGDYFGQSYLPDSLSPHSANQAALCLENFVDNPRLSESPPPLPNTPPFEEERPIPRQPKQSIMDTFGVLGERASGTETLISTLYQDSLKTSLQDLLLTEKTQAIYSKSDMNEFPYPNSIKDNAVNLFGDSERAATGTQVSTQYRDSLISGQYQDGLKVNDEDLLLTEKPHAIYNDNRDTNRFPYPNPRKDNAVTFLGKLENATAETRISTQYHDHSLKARGKTNAIYSHRDIDSEKAAGTVISTLCQDSLKVSDDEDHLFTGRILHAVYAKSDIDGFPYPSSRKDDDSEKAAETVRNAESNLFDLSLQASLEDSLADIWGVTKDKPDREAQSIPFDKPSMPEKKDYTCNAGISKGEAFVPPSLSYTFSGDESEFAHEAAYPWNDLPVNTPPSVENEIRFNSTALPIYDQSPMSSMKRNNHTSNVVGKEELQMEKEMAAKGMSFKRFVEDMASSVLDSSSNELLFEKRGFCEEGEAATDHQKAIKENVCDDKDSLLETKGDQILVNCKDSSWLGAQTPSGLIDTDKENSLCQKEELKQQSADVGNDANGNQTSFASLEGQAEALGLQTIRNADLEEIRELGSGTYGTVYYGKWRGSDVAIKRIKASCFSGSPSERKRLISDFWKEACMLGQLHHPNVVAFYGVVQDAPGGTLATVTEYMVNGSLKQVLQKKDRTIDRRKRLLIAMDAAFGMEYLHSKNIVHFDLKCENLLVNMRDPQRPICKVGDFGLSKMKQHTLVSGGVRGTLPWMAPELLSGKSSMVTEKIDVYSFGIAMWELLTCEEPYTDMHCGAIIGGIVSNSLRPPVPSWCDPAWRSLMERCWSAAPEERPPFPEIVNNLRDMATSVNLK